MSVEFEDGRYTVFIERHIDAPVESVFRVITDYDNLTVLDEHILESREIERKSDTASLVYTKLRDCVIIFCKTVERVEEVEERSNQEVVSTADPEQSDVLYNVNRWVLTEKDGGTHLEYRLEMEPDFWVPRLVGRSALKRRLLKNSIRALDRLEQLARERAGYEETG